ncbi:MAG: type II toxin-antitoxin system VapC family toxin [Rhodospirillaceae bacterium]|nr:type II toxin-antitoxin system VapC family toxin [Rhodospirillaceae bacterium]
MKLTVDASVVVKWYVSETHSEEARLLLAHRLERFAPDFVLVELANIFWKKARLHQIGDPNTYFQELHRVREAVVLSPSADLIGRAAQIAAQIDHPVYDCLYIACAEATGSTLITADRRLKDTVADHALTLDAQFIGGQGVADNIRTAATALVITHDKVAELVAANDLLDATEENVRAALVDDGVEAAGIGREDQLRILHSPAGKRLEELFLELNEEERIDLLALGWLGQGYSGTEWQPIFERACKLIGVHGDDKWRYDTSLAVYWRDGYERLTGISL